MTTLYFRNHERSMRMLAEEGVSHLVFTRHNLGRQRHDGLVYIRQFYSSTGIRPKVMLVGPGGASCYIMDDKLTQPRAVYPTWSGKNDTFDELVKYCEDPWGYREDLCMSKTLDPRIRPVFGQDHKIVLYNNPLATSAWWRNIFRLQIDFPEVRFHLNGTTSFNLMFGGNWDSVDFGLEDPGATKDKVYLPGGNYIRMDRSETLSLLVGWSPWIEMLGFDPRSVVTDIETRLRFNIRSATWAAVHYKDNFRFRNEDLLTEGDISASTEKYVPRNSHSIVSRRGRATLKDAEKVLCDRCSIAPQCKLFRSGQICGLKESEMSDLARFFQSRDAGKIVDGLAEIAKMQADRLGRAMDAEDANGIIDPEVTKMANSLFANGVKLAKLVDPELAGPGTKVQVNVGTTGNVDLVSMSNPKQLVAGVMRALEDAGVKREDITPEMIAGAVSAMAHGTPMKAITATAVNSEDEKAAEALRQKIVASTTAATIDGEVLPIPVSLPI